MIISFCAYLIYVFYTNLLTFSAQAKISKRAKKSKPVEEPDLTEPNASASEPPSAPAPDTAASTEEQTMAGSDNPEIPSSTQPADDPDVVITRTEYVEPEDPLCWLDALLRKNCWSAAGPDWISLTMLT